MTMEKLRKKWQTSWKQYLYDIHLDVNRKKHEVIITAVKYKLAVARSRVNFLSSAVDSNQVNLHKLKLQTLNCIQSGIISCEDVDLNSGITCPCFLVKTVSIDRKGVAQASIYLIQLSDLGLESHGHFPLEHSTGGDDIHLSILNDSIVSFVSGRRLCVVKFQGSKKAAQICTCLLQDVTSGHPKHSDLKALDCKLISSSAEVDSGSADNIYDILWLFTVANPRYSESVRTESLLNLEGPNKSTAVIVRRSQDNTCQIQHVVSGTGFLPDIYGSIVTSLKITRVSHYVPSDVPKDSHHNEPYIQGDILVYTTHGQFLYFENGDLKKCIPLEVSSTRPMTLQFENCVGLSYYVVQTKEDEFTVIDSQSFQVKESFDNVSSLHIGDFVGSGGDQILVVSEEDKLSPPEEWRNFIVTDFHTCNIKHSQSTVTASEGTEDGSQIAAVQALQSRLQASITYVSGVQREYQNKLRLVEKGFSILEEMSSGRDTSRVSRGRMSAMMPLVGEKPSESIPDSPTQRMDRLPTKTICAHNIWKKIFNDFCVIGVVFSNSSKRTINSLRVSLVPREADQPVDCATFFVAPQLEPLDFPMELSQGGDGPKPKVRRMDGSGRPLMSQCELKPGDSVQALVRTRLAAFCTGHTWTVTLMAAWTETGEIYEQTLETLRCEHVGSVQLSAQEVVEGSLQVQPHLSMSAGDILVMDVTQMHFPLSVHCACLDFSKNDASHILQGALQFRQMVTSSCWVRLDGSPLNYVRVEVCTQTTSSALDIKVHVRDEPQLFLLVHAIYAVLPDDAIILPRRTSDVTSLTTSVLNNIIAETDFVRDSAKSLLSRPAQGEPARMAGEGGRPEDKLHTMRQDFLQKKNQLRGSNNTKVDDVKLVLFQKQLKHLEKRTNESMNTLSRRLNDSVIS